MGDKIQTEFKKIISRKHILVDTCVLIDIVTHLAERGGFLTFFQTLVDSGCSLVVSPLIQCELFNGELVPKTRSIKAQILYQFTEIPLPQEVYEWITEFSWIYASQSITKVGIVDFSNITFLRRYPQNILLASSNHKDYSTRLLDREYVYTIDDCEDRVHTIGFYKWNKNKYDKLTEKIKHLLV